MMFETIRNGLLASLGAVAFDIDRLRDLMDELVARGDLTSDQGKRLLETLVQRGRAESERISSRIVSEIQGLRDYLPATRRDLQALEGRVGALERLVEARPEGAAPTARPDHPEPGLPQEFPGEALPPREDGAVGQA